MHQQVSIYLFYPPCDLAALSPHCPPHPKSECQCCQSKATPPPCHLWDYYTFMLVLCDKRGRLWDCFVREQPLIWAALVEPRLLLPLISLLFTSAHIPSYIWWIIVMQIDISQNRHYDCQSKKKKKEKNAVTDTLTMPLFCCETWEYDSETKSGCWNQAADKHSADICYSDRV